MLAELEPVSRAALLEWYAVEAEAAEAAQASGADELSERTARLLGRVGVLGARVWESLPREHPSSWDAIFTVGEAGMALARPPYWTMAERFLRFALDNGEGVLDESHLGQLARFSLASQLQEHRSAVSIDIDSPLGFPDQCLSIRAYDDDTDEPALLVLDYIVAGQFTAGNDVTAVAHFALQQNSGLGIGKLFLSSAGLLTYQLALPRHRVSHDLLAGMARLAVKMGLHYRQRLRGE